MLLGNAYDQGHEILISSQDRPDVWNGTDAFQLLIGEDTPLTGGATISSQYSSNVYNMALLFKANETWMMKWYETTPTAADEESTMVWERFLISSTVGCVAPGTIKTASVSFERNITATKMVVIWRAHDGIYVSDGRAPMCVSDDIRCVFDQTKTPHINLSATALESAFVDEAKQEYHWLWSTDVYSIAFNAGSHEPNIGETLTDNTSGATGVLDGVTVTGGTYGGGNAAGTYYLRDVTGTWGSGHTIKQGTDTVATTTSGATLVTDTALINRDKEYVLDLKRWRWFEIDRGKYNALQCGTSVEDSSGNKYAYGGLDCGNVERLENGTDFLSGGAENTIDCTLETGDQVLIPGDLLTETTISRACLVLIPKTTEDCTLTHTIDGLTTGTDYTIAMQDATHDFATLFKDIFSTDGIYHRFKLAVSSYYLSKPLEPIYLSVYFTKARDRLR
jgi:hypothetical protein